MAIPRFKFIPDDADNVTIQQTVNWVFEELKWLFEGAVDFKNIKVGGIIADNIKAGAIETDKLDAGAVTADKITVSELSAISANLGTILAGLIIGTEIMTKAAGNYPRTELSSTKNLLSAEQSAGYAINISPGGLQPNPFIEFLVGGLIAGSITMFSSPNLLSMSTNSSADISIQSGKSLSLSSSGPLQIDGFNGYTGSFSFVSAINFVDGTYTMRTATVRKGIITGVS